MSGSSFGTAINCIDGRVQEPVINWMKKNYNVDYVDSITLEGPDLVKSWNIVENVIALWINDKWEVEIIKIR